MHVLMLSGSRDKEGRTARAINAIRQGVVKAGGSSEVLFLLDYNIDHCQQCNQDGWGICEHEGYCIINDDFQKIVDKIKMSDVIVFASPVYFRDFSDSMRRFLDRLCRICFRNTAPVSQGISAAGLCLAGGGGGGGPIACLSLEGTLQRCHFDVIDIIPLRRQNLEAKIPALLITGEWLATKPTSK